MLRANPQVLFQKLGNEAVILHLNSEKYFGLDEVGTRIWEILNQEGCINKTVPILLNEFEVEEPILKKDIEDLVIELRAEKILEDV